MVFVSGGALAAGVSGFGYRFQLWNYLPAFKILIGGIAAVVVGTVAALAGIYFGWGSGQAGSLYGLIAALVLGLVILVPVVSSARLVRTLPWIHDISTDTENPPAFVAILTERAAAPNSAEYGGPGVAKRQRAAYPDVEPLRLSLAPSAVFDGALKIARDLGWKIIDTDPTAGRIEASDQTFWYGFIDDIVVRVSPAAGGSRVDIRSVSRVGQSDLGANARRIRKFLRGLSGYAGRDS